MNKIIIFSICLLTPFLFLCFLSDAANDKTTELEVNNVYKVRLVLEVKCDYQWETKKYKYYQIITIPKKGRMTLLVPSSLRRCEIWPLDFKIF